MWRRLKAENKEAIRHLGDGWILNNTIIIAARIGAAGGRGEGHLVLGQRSEQLQMHVFGRERLRGAGAAAGTGPRRATVSQQSPLRGDPTKWTSSRPIAIDSSFSQVIFPDQVLPDLNERCVRRDWPETGVYTVWKLDWGSTDWPWERRHDHVVHTVEIMSLVMARLAGALRGAALRGSPFSHPSELSPSEGHWDFDWHSCAGGAARGPRGGRTPADSSDERPTFTTLPVNSTYRDWNLFLHWTWWGAGGHDGVGYSEHSERLARLCRGGCQPRRRRHRRCHGRQGRWNEGLGLRMWFQGVLEVADVVNHMLDHFQLGEPLVLGHEGHELLQLGQVHLDLLVLDVAPLLVDTTRGHTVEGRRTHISVGGSTHCRTGLHLQALHTTKHTKSKRRSEEKTWHGTP